MFSVIPVQTKDWEWEVGMTFSKNWSEVKELWDGANEYVLTGINMGAGSVDFVAEVGQPLGVFKVPQMAKTEDGKTIVNGAGIPTVDGSKKETIGSSTPNFLMGINTRLSWKDLHYLLCLTGEMVDTSIHIRLLHWLLREMLLIRYLMIDSLLSFQTP